MVVESTSHGLRSMIVEMKITIKTVVNFQIFFSIWTGRIFERVRLLTQWLLQTLEPLLSRLLIGLFIIL